MIRVEHVYDHKERDGDARFLVDRLWPRGLRKEALEIDGWLQDVAPSARLRTWFGHDPSKWQELKLRYFKELDEKPAAWRPLLEAARRGNLVLLEGARDQEHNQAVALKEYLETKLREAGSSAMGVERLT
jgi:uncharacterized protein YeaO (DUF488 family)